MIYYIQMFSKFFSYIIAFRPQW